MGFFPGRWRLLNKYWQLRIRALFVWRNITMIDWTRLVLLGWQPWMTSLRWRTILKIKSRKAGAINQTFRHKWRCMVHLVRETQYNIFPSQIRILLEIDIFLLQLTYKKRNGYCYLYAILKRILIFKIKMARQTPVSDHFPS